MRADAGVRVLGDEQCLTQSALLRLCRTRSEIARIAGTHATPRSPLHHALPLPNTLLAAVQIETSRQRDGIEVDTNPDTNPDTNLGGRWRTSTKTGGGKTPNS